MLEKIHIYVLDVLVDSDEPFEVIDNVIKEYNFQSTADDTLKILFDLYSFNLIKIKQSPIKALGQDFPEFEIIPKEPKDIIGTLNEFYAKYFKSRDYLWKLDLGKTGKPGGVPFGIWIFITDQGRNEWGKEEYLVYWEENK